MNQKHQNPPAFLAAILMLMVFCVNLLPAQTKATPSPSTGPSSTGDPTASIIPPAKFNIQPVEDQPKFSIGSPILLGTGLASTLAGTILCLYSGSLKPGYDTAFALWELDPNATTLANRDAQSVNFLLPLLIGAGLDVLGIILTIGGFDQGTGIKNLSPVPPTETLSPDPTATPLPEKP